MTEPTPHSPIPSGYAAQQARVRAWNEQNPRTPTPPASYPVSEPGPGRPRRKRRLFGWGSLLYWVMVAVLLVVDLSLKLDSGGKHPAAGGVGAYFVIAFAVWLVGKVVFRGRRRHAGGGWRGQLERMADRYGSASPGEYQQRPAPTQTYTTAGYNAYVNTHGSAAANQQMNAGGPSSFG